MPGVNEIESYDLQYGAHKPCTAEDGCELYYEKRGDGPNITLVNNMFIISPLWRNFTQQLSPSFTLLSYDLRNQGASSMTEGPISLRTHVNDLQAVIRAAQVERTVVLGTSVGSLICRDLALSRPDLVSGLILVGPTLSQSGSPRREFFRRSWLKSLDSGGVEQLFAHMYPQVFGDRTVAQGGVGGYLALRERFLALNSIAQLQTNLALKLDVDGLDDLATIDCPVLIICGESDYLNCATSVTELESAFPRARSVIVPGAGHVPYFDAPDQFQAAVSAFVEHDVVSYEADVRGR